MSFIAITVHSSPVGFVAWHEVQFLSLAHIIPSGYILSFAHFVYVMCQLALFFTQRIGVLYFFRMVFLSSPVAIAFSTPFSSACELPIISMIRVEVHRHLFLLVISRILGSVFGSIFCIQLSQAFLYILTALRGALAGEGRSSGRRRASQNSCVL